MKNKSIWKEIGEWIYYFFIGFIFILTLFTPLSVIIMIIVIFYYLIILIRDRNK